MQAVEPIPFFRAEQLIFRRIVPRELDSGILAVRRISLRGRRSETVKIFRFGSELFRVLREIEFTVKMGLQSNKILIFRYILFNVIVAGVICRTNRLHGRKGIFREFFFLSERHNRFVECFCGCFIFLRRIRNFFYQRNRNFPETVARRYFYGKGTRGGKR